MLGILRHSNPVSFAFSLSSAGRSAAGRNFPQPGYRKTGGIRLPQGAGQPCLCAPSHAMMIWVGREGPEHPRDQFIRGQGSADQGFLDPDHFPGNAFGQFAVLGP
jgi:hypothetical protein